jgi:hypothetical protein
MIKLTDILNEDENPCWKGYKQIGMKKKGGKEVPNCVPESVVNEDIDDLVGDTYSFEIGSGTDKLIKPNPREYVIKKISEALQHHLFDDDFYLNYLDSSDKKIYLNLFQGEVLKPFLNKNNINRTLKKYFTIDSNRKIISWKLSDRDSEKFRDEFFRKNKKIPSNIKREYYDYRLDYAGVKLKESTHEELSSSERLELYKLYSRAMKAMPQSPKQKKIKQQINKLRTKAGMKPLPEGAINELGIFNINNYINGIIPASFFDTTTKDKKEKLNSTIKDLVNTLNNFWKQHNIPFRVKK